ncbi:hypothetical protein [Flavobacterium sp. JP2137]|uniref:hypothetical protein n=1 Tax=Flavobacterium sp. JP2137 TaxID=3414510 RepID=UPI003D2FF6B0
MKKRLRLGVLCALLISATGLYAQDSCVIAAHLNDFIKIEKEVHKEKVYLLDKAVAVDADRCFSTAVNANIENWNYVLTNFKARLHYEELEAITDAELLQKTYIKTLERDSLFQSVLTDFSKKVVEKSMPKDTVSLPDLMNKAVKFFSILKIDDQERLVGKVCVGLNDIGKTEPKRHAFAEAFCFSTILANYQGEEFNMYREFVSGLTELYQMNLGLDRSERHLRAQGAMYALMFKNENLRKMLLLNYERQREYLPFVLKV